MNLLKLGAFPGGGPIAVFSFNEFLCNCAITPGLPCVRLSGLPSLADIRVTLFEANTEMPEFCICSRFCRKRSLWWMYKTTPSTCPSPTLRTLSPWRISDPLLSVVAAKFFVSTLLPTCEGGSGMTEPFWSSRWTISRPTLMMQPTVLALNTCQSARKLSLTGCNLL